MRAQDQEKWMCPDGQYASLVQRLCDADPRLRKRDTKAVSQGTPWPPLSRGRVINVCAGKDKIFRVEQDWSDAAAFVADLKTGVALDERKNNILLVEGLSPTVIDGLGSRFNINPSFFVDHERVVVFNERHDGCSDYPTLPHSIRWKAGTNGLMLRYFEVMELNPVPDDFRMSCADTGRHIGAVRTRGRISPVAIVRRKCSIWPVTHSSGGSTCIIICDPPIREVRTKLGFGKRTRVLPVRTAPYQGGYVDFLDQEIQRTVLRGPPRTCMLDDLLFYLTTHGPLLPSPRDTAQAAIFAQKIIASHYLILHNFMASMLSHQHWILSRREDMSHLEVESVEQQWSDVQSWDRRFNEYCSDIGEVMLRLGIDEHATSTPRTGSGSSWHDSAADFLFLMAQFAQLRDRVRQINAAITGLAGIAGNRQSQREQQVSLRETRRTKALTLIGLMFIPLAYTSALFSMNERFMPGAREFWLYFAVSIPLGLVVLLLYALLDAKPTMSFLSTIGLFRDVDRR